MNNNTLCPHTGALRNHLAINQGAHLPKHPNNNQMRCALHMATKRKCGHIFSIVPHAMCICVLIVSHIFILLRRSMTYNVSSSTLSQMYRLFRVGTTMGWVYCDGIVAIHHINNVTGLTTTSFTNELIHHCDRTKPNEDLSFGLKIINNNCNMKDKKH